MKYIATLVTSLRRKITIFVLGGFLVITVLIEGITAQPFVYLANLGSASVSVIDIATDTVVTTVVVIPQPIGIAITSDGAYAYLTHLTSPNVSIIEIATNTVIDTVDVGSSSFGIAITPDGAFAYVAHSSSDSISVIDIATNTVIAIVGVGQGPSDIGITPDGAFAYVVNQSESNVSVIDIATNTVISTVGVGIYPIGIAITPDGAFAYVTNQSADGVSVIDIASNTVIATVDVGGGTQTGVAITPDGAFAYVTNHISAGAVWVVETITNAVVATIEVGTDPREVAISPDGASVYVTNEHSSNVSVIDIATNTVISTVGVGNIPIGIAITPVPPSIVVETDSLDFGEIVFSGTSVRNVSVINPGNALLIITSINITGADSVKFVVDESLFSLAQGDSQILSVSFTPADTGRFIASLEIQSNGGNKSVLLSGTSSLGNYTVLNTDDSGIGSLRQTILDANSNAGKDTIRFFISGNGPHTIQPNSALPVISDPVVIDGYTQPGASPNSNPINLGSNALLMIEIDGTNAGDSEGFTILSGNSVLRGMVINRFSSNGINCNLGGGNTIEGNFIGTDVTGTVSLGNKGEGVLIVDSQDNLVGGVNPEAANLLSGNGAGSAGIAIFRALATGNHVKGNFIGTDVTGTHPLGNGSEGVLLFDAPDNIIGGIADGARNIISGNSESGVVIFRANGNLILGNYIGTDVTGTLPLGNGREGIRIIDASNTVIGGTIVEANVIAFNFWPGVTVRSGTGNKILSNSIFGNQQIGIDLWSQNTFGLTENDPDDADTGPNNLQNFPDIFSAGVDQFDDLLIEYYIDSDTTNSDYPLLAQFFKADPGGEGKRFLGEDIFTALDHENGNKTANLGQVSVLEDSLDVFIVATTTDEEGNTSEFTSTQVVVGIETGGDVLPEKFVLFDAFPNPFNPSTTLSYALQRQANVSLIIYNLRGQEVMRWDEQNVVPGYYEKIWNGTNQFGTQVSSGVYFYRLVAGDFVQTRKMVLLK